MKAYPILTVLAGLAAALHVAVFFPIGPIDDEFICWRFARNLALGEGLTFNPGERLQSFTCPLWVLAHALWQWLGGAPLLLTRSAGLIAAAASAWAAARVYRKLLPKARVPLPAIVVACLPALAFHGAAGLGTLVLGALLLCAWAAWEERAWTLAALLFGLAALLRLEALLFACPFVWCVLRGFPEKRDALRPVVCALGPATLWVIWASAYFGDPLPHTYALKKLPARADLAYGLSYLLESSAVAAVLPIVLAAMLAAKLSRPARAMTLALALHTSYVVWVGGDYLPQARFFVPTLPLAIVLACLGIARFAPRIAVLFAILVGAGPQWIHAPLSEDAYLAPQTRSFARLSFRFQEERWAFLGRELGRVAPPDTLVVLGPIGAFGFESGLALIDPLGLTLREVADAAPDLTIGLKGHHRHDARSVLARNPDWIILGNGVRDGSGMLSVSQWEQGIFYASRFRERYRRWTVVFGDLVPGNDHIDHPADVWVRKGSRPPVGATRAIVAQRDRRFR